jgi:hypothetical protein
MLKKRETMKRTKMTSKRRGERRNPANRSFKELI